MPLPSIDVLVVDDNEDLLDLTSRALERTGVTVRTAQTFLQLEQHLDHVHPRLILMDVQMPELFGDEVASLLRNVRGLDAKIYLYSSIDPDELARLARTGGLDGWISKSSGLTHLIAEVRRALG